MYESPIELVYHETFPKLIKQQEDLIMRGCLDMGVYVDKEELVKALQYDRGQYEKGFADGRPPKGEWEDKWNSAFKCDIPYCSNCNTPSISKFNYCPHCGAMMSQECNR